MPSRVLVTLYLSDDTVAEGKYSRGESYKVEKFLDITFDYKARISRLVLSSPSNKVGNVLTITLDCLRLDLCL